jgi:hypothetical protein
VAENPGLFFASQFSRLVGSATRQNGFQGTRKPAFTNEPGALISDGVPGPTNVMETGTISGLLSVAREGFPGSVAVAPG